MSSARRRLIAMRKAQQNKAVIDPWTAVHFGVGLAFGLLGVPRLAGIGLAIAYEFAEHGFESTAAGAKFFNVSGPETLGNAVADVAVFAVGAELGHAWNRTGDED